MKTRADDDRRLCIIHKTYPTLHAPRFNCHQRQNSSGQAGLLSNRPDTEFARPTATQETIQCLEGVRIMDTWLPRTIVHGGVAAVDWHAHSRVSASKFMRRPNSRTVTRFIRHSTSRKLLINDHFRWYNALSRRAAPRLRVMTSSV